MARLLQHLVGIAIFSVFTPTLSAQVSIIGSVKDMHTDAPIPGVHVDLRTKMGLTPEVPSTTYTNADGEFELEKVAEGEWRVRVVYGNDQVLERIIMTPSFAVQQTALTFQFVLNQAWVDANDPTGFFDVRQKSEEHPATHVRITGVIKESGSTEEISGARISLLSMQEPTNEGMGYVVAAQAKSDDSGAFEIPSISPGPYFIDVNHPEYETIVRSILKVDESIDLTVRMWNKQDRPSVAGLVFDSHGNQLDNAILSTRNVHTSTLIGTFTINSNPISGATVYLLNASNEPLPEGLEGVTDTTGLYRIERIEPGTYKIRVESNQDVYEIDGVELIPGFNELNIHF